MQINRVLGYFYTKVFIAIIPGRTYSNIAVIHVKGSSILKHYTRKFEGIEFNTAMQLFVNEAAQFSPLAFTALLSDASDQGAIATCSKQQASQFMDVMLTESICLEERWMMYLSRDTLYQLQERYRTVGLDFVFSPFALIKQFYSKPIAEELALFILNEESSIALAVFDHNEFHFADYTLMDQRFSVSEKGVNVENDAPLRYESIEKMLDTYYNDVRIKSSFIEKIYLADAHLSSSSLASLLEEGLFTNLERNRVDVAFETARLAAREVGYAV